MGCGGGKQKAEPQINKQTKISRTIVVNSNSSLHTHNFRSGRCLGGFNLAKKKGGSLRKITPSPLICSLIPSKSSLFIGYTPERGAIQTLPRCSPRRAAGSGASARGCACARGSGERSIRTGREELQLRDSLIAASRSAQPFGVRTAPSSPRGRIERGRARGRNALGQRKEGRSGGGGG